MLKLLPILALALWGVAQWQISSWRLRRDLDTRSEPLDDPTLEAVVRRLGRAVEQPDLRAWVYDMEAFNGLAAPDGRVFVTRGVIDKYKLNRISAEEVGSIIAHELGHVALGHSRRRMIDWTGQSVAATLLAVVLGRFVPFIGAWIAHALGAMVAARLSRRDEFEADAFAAALMRRAKVAPEAQVSMLEKLTRMAPNGEGPVGSGASWLASHPPTKERVRAIRELHAHWDAGREAASQDSDA